MSTFPGMNHWFSAIASGSALPPGAVSQLHDDGFAVVPGPLPQEDLGRLADAYDKAVAEADPADARTGRTNTRVSDFVNRGEEFDGLYVHPPVLEACCHVIGQEFRLSSMLARTLMPRTQMQELHVDFASDAEGWPMVGFIFMIDEFRADNGATCFVRGSHGLAAVSSDERPTQACGPAGSMIVYNGSVWHGHGTNETEQPRRSIQGAYIRRNATSGIDLPARMRPETLARIGPLARYLIGV